MCSADEFPNATCTIAQDIRSPETVTVELSAGPLPFRVTLSVLAKGMQVPFESSLDTCQASAPRVQENSTLLHSSPPTGVRTRCCSATQLTKERCCSHPSAYRHGHCPLPPALGGARLSSTPLPNLECLWLERLLPRTAGLAWCFLSSLQVLCSLGCSPSTGWLTALQSHVFSFSFDIFPVKSESKPYFPVFQWRLAVCIFHSANNF